jgi:plasmid stabilization system protein ParE
MREVYRAPRAREDVIEAAAYIAMDNMDAARRFLKAVRDDCARLAEYPGLGALRGYRRRGLRQVRSWPVGGFLNYLIFYGIEVVRVLHGALGVDGLVHQT